MNNLKFYFYDKYKCLNFAGCNQLFLTMEQVWSNVSVWGALTVLFTGVRLLRQFLKFDSATKIGQLWRILRYQAVHFVRFDYKIWAVPLLAMLMVTWAGNSVQGGVLQVFFWANVVWWLTSVAMSLWLKNIQHPIFAKLQTESKPLTIWTLVGALLLNATLIYVYASAFNDAKALLSIIASVFLGTSFVIGSFRLWQYGMGLHPKSIQSSLLSNERLEALLISTIAAVLLAQVYGNHIYFSILPLVLAALFLVVFGLEKTVLTHRGILKNEKVSKVLVLMVSMGLVWLVLHFYLPDFWLRHGQSYQRQDLVYTILMGLLIGTFSDQLISFYRYLQQKYTFYFLDRPIFHKYLTYLLRGFITWCLIMLISWGILYAYRHLELYGLTLVMISLLSNIGSKISFDIPAK